MLELSKIKDVSLKSDGAYYFRYGNSYPVFYTFTSGYDFFVMHSMSDAALTGYDAKDVYMHCRNEFNATNHEQDFMLYV